MGGKNFARPGERILLNSIEAIIFNWSEKDIRQWYTFSGLVSTLKRIKPKHGIKTTINDKINTRAGFSATHVPYFLWIQQNPSA